MNIAVWLFDHGIRVFPIKPRDKEPACKSWDDYVCERRIVFQFENYGVPLGLLAVADSDNAEAESWNAANLPDTPFKVTTGRGRHRYYRIVGDAPHFFHRNSLTIEFRHKGQYVVGPGSVHASGAVYTADDWSWKIEDIPIFPVADFLWDDRPVGQRGSADGDPFILPPTIKAGERHDLMFRLMRSLQARGVSVEGVLAACQAENRIKCVPPISSEELDKYLRRVWKYPDRQGFDRAPQDEWTLAGGLLEVGMERGTAIAAVRSVSPGFAPDGPQAEAIPDVVLQPSQPSQPSRPFSPMTDEPALVPEAPPDIATCDIAKPSLLCCRCGHGWIQKRKAPPKNCPNCRTTLWNREQIILVEDDDGEEIIDPDYGREDDETIDLDDEDGDIIDLDEGHEDDEIIEEDK